MKKQISKLTAQMFKKAKQFFSKLYAYLLVIFSFFLAGFKQKPKSEAVTPELPKQEKPVEAEEQEKPIFKTDDEVMVVKSDGSIAMEYNFGKKFKVIDWEFNAFYKEVRYNCYLVGGGLQQVFLADQIELCK